MEALHEQARELGATTIALNVFGHNATAIRLYDSLGYAVTAQQMRRDL
jgi:ribosomal protein S18 acetylase RimI-like enzyme